MAAIYHRGGEDSYLFPFALRAQACFSNYRQFPNPGVLRGGNLAISFAQASGFSFTLSYSQADGGISIGFFCFFSPVVNFPKVDGERLGCLKFKFPRPRSLDFWFATGTLSRCLEDVS